MLQPDSKHNGLFEKTESQKSDTSVRVDVTPKPVVGDSNKVVR